VKALLISPSAAAGGAERVLTATAAHLPANGVQVRAVLLERGPLERWLGDVGCPVEVFEAGRTRQVARTLEAIHYLRKRAADADVVVSNQSKGHVYGGVAALLARRPAVWWQHGVPERDRINRVAAHVRAAAVVCPSRASVEAQRALTPRSRIACIASGVDVRLIRDRIGSGAAVRSANGWTGHVVGVISRLEPFKGHETFLRCASRLARDPSIAFAIVGGAILGHEGDYAERIEQLADDLGIRERVLFAGHQDDVYPWFDAFTVVVNPAERDSFGVVSVEAMATGKPVVAAMSPGSIDIIEDGESGLLVPCGDDEAMAAAVARVLADRQLAERLSSGGRARAEHFAIERTAAQLAELLRDVV
jgi:glycosyltransferase involved in cell wall biosynthesis